MMRRALTIAVLALGIFAGSLAVHEQANAATHNPKCMSKAEYRKIHRGMTPAKVARIVGSKGHVSASSSYSGYRNLNVDYRTCTRYGSAFVSYANPEPGTPVVVVGKGVVW